MSKKNGQFVTDSMDFLTAGVECASNHKLAGPIFYDLRYASQLGQLKHFNYGKIESRSSQWIVLK